MCALPRFIAASRISMSSAKRSNACPEPNMTDRFSADDHRHMARALQLAEQGLYTTDPNPRVGCVLVRDGVVVGEGAHLKAGEPHAEVHALRAAGDLARAATAYVTLEPCSHHGRTPPCADALVKAGVTRVVAAMQDPNPLVAGQGLARIAATGIATASGLLELQARRLNPGFISRIDRKSTRLNSSHVRISYAVFCLKKKTKRVMQ